jgi:choline-sulfatase
MKSANLLFILSDEHNPRVLGASGHQMSRTPNLDRLAARGVRFTSAYCNSPICVRGRAGDRSLRRSDPLLGQCDPL